MGNKIKLIDHRRKLAHNIYAYSFELEDGNIGRLVKSLIPHLRKAGFQVSLKKSGEDLKKFVRFLFDTQGHRPLFHVEGTELPLCWNSPKDWDKDYIKYEWGHLHSFNRDNTDAYKLENLGLYSARCNQHIQTSMHIEELMVYGGILAQRISNVLTERRFLFESSEWKQLIANLK